MLHNGMLLSPAGADMSMTVPERQTASRVQWNMMQQQQQQQQHHSNNNNCVVVPYDSVMMPLFHGFLDDSTVVSAAEVFDLQDHKPDTFLGAHDLPTFGDISLAGKVAPPSMAGNTSTTTSNTLDEINNCFTKTCSCCQMSTMEDEKFVNTEPDSTKTEADDEIVVVVEECDDEKRIGVEAKLESKPKKRTRAVTSSDDSKENSKASAVHKPNYIHVRARRGQATDSHSLAERARREKISNKMKCLQDLVPGCSKIIGKAGVLDEIINYVQSLQSQVEFLSMKLATQNPSPGFDINNFSASFPVAPMSSASANLAELQINTGQQVTTNYELERPIYNVDSTTTTTTSSSVSIPELYNIDSTCFTQIQPLVTWESD
ncbi:hypothetical protein ACOSP7_022847 [Xanthoceras sorbifolium]